MTEKLRKHIDYLMNRVDGHRANVIAGFGESVMELWWVGSAAVIVQIFSNDSWGYYVSSPYSEIDDILKDFISIKEL